MLEVFSYDSIEIFQYTDAKRAKELEEEELRRQEQAAKDQADAGSPREETGKHYIFNFKNP